MHSTLSPAARHVTGKRIYIGAGLYHRVDDSRNLHTVVLRNRCHHHTPDPGPVDTADLLQRNMEIGQTVVYLTKIQAVVKGVL